MFPATITIHNEAQMAAVMAAFRDTAEPAPQPEPKSVTYTSRRAADTAEPAPQPEPKSVTYDQAADAVKGLARTKGRDAAVGVLQRFGVSNLKDVKPEQYADVIAACQAAEA